MRLNGWQRLWVVLSGLYFLAVCTFAVLTFPDGESLSRESANLAVEIALQAQGKSAQTAGDQRALLNAMRDLEYGAARVRAEAYGDLSDTELIQRIRAKWEGQANFAPLNEKLRRDTKRIRDRRFNFALQALVWWIIPVLMVYALGWATAWVVRGFQNKGRV
jgi:hypothetical protein